MHPGVAATNPLSAAKAALKALGVKRLGLLTPYSPEVTEAMQAKFNAAGIAVNLVGSFYEQSDFVVGKVDPNSILQSAIKVGTPEDVDGVFISCTSLRAAGIIEDAEKVLGKPVTASNHALAWHLLRLAGIDDKVPGAGRLFQQQLAKNTIKPRKLSYKNLSLRTRKLLSLAAVFTAAPWLITWQKRVGKTSSCWSANN